MKKIEVIAAANRFYPSKDAEIHSFETASVARAFPIASAVQTRQVKKPLMFPLSHGIEAWRKNEALDSFDVLKKR